LTAYEALSSVTLVYLKGAQDAEDPPHEVAEVLLTSSASLAAQSIAMLHDISDANVRSLYDLFCEELEERVADIIERGPG
jgi:hypothetical protein